jgi:hypothetical protein
MAVGASTEKKEESPNLPVAYFFPPNPYPNVE